MMEVSTAKCTLQPGEKPVRGRFAPSPSGRMHLGNVFCALIAWLSVRSAHGEMVLRVEDLDPDRCRPEYARQLEEDLLWLGLDWDEGGSQGGVCEPYYQSRCSEIYRSYYEILKQKNLLYPCFCSRAELHAAQAPHASDGQIVYSGRCRSLSREEAAHLAGVRAPAVRILVPDEVISFTDGHCGVYSQNLAKNCGDFIVRRSDGVFSYQLAVVVDDLRMGINQVARGRDLLSSTPRQLYLYRLFQGEAPSFYHIPLLLAPDGRRLSKREHDLDMGALRARFCPEELLGRLAFLAGLTDTKEPVRASELIPLFSWDKVPKQDIFVPVSLF